MYKNIYVSGILNNKSQNLKYTFSGLQKPKFYQTEGAFHLSKSDGEKIIVKEKLKKAMERILHKPVYFKKYGFGSCKVDLCEGIKGIVHIGAEDVDTSITVKKDKYYEHADVFYWLNNWHTEYNTKIIMGTDKNKGEFFEESCIKKEHDILEDIMENFILKEPIFWVNISLNQYSADLGNGILAVVCVEFEDKNTLIKIKRGKCSVSRMISNCWLSNWKLVKSEENIKSKKFLSPSYEHKNHEILEHILDNHILKRKIIWKNEGNNKWSVDLENNVRATAYVRTKSEDTFVVVENNDFYVCKTISEYWLINWEAENNDLGFVFV